MKALRYISAILALASLMGANAQNHDTEHVHHTFAERHARMNADTLITAPNLKSASKIGTLIYKAPDSTQTHKRRGLKQFVIIPKGEVQGGIQMSYASISSNNSEFLMLLKDLDASGDFLRIAPYISYSYRCNKTIGLKFSYSNASASINAGDLELLSDDLNFTLDNIRGRLTSYGVGMFHRSYIGLDRRGRIGLFSDIMLSYQHSRMKFAYNDQTQDSYSLQNQLKLSFHPGVIIFLMNNVSLNVSFSVGSVSYNNVRYFQDGHSIGSRDHSQAKFKLDILDISYGVTIHL